MSDHRAKGQYTTDIAMCAKAIKSRLVENDLLDQKAINRIVSFAKIIDPSNGACVVVKAWTSGTPRP